MIIVEKITGILEEMKNDTNCDLNSYQYQNFTKGNVRFDNKMPNPTCLFLQIADWSIDMTRISKREAAEISVFFLDKETKLDNEAISQDAIVTNMADLGCDFLKRLMKDKSLRIMEDTIRVKSVYYQSDSNRTGVCLQFRIEETQGTCI